MGEIAKDLVVYWNTIPSPYVVDRLNALAEHGGLNFEVWFNERIESDRSWGVDESQWIFRYRYVPKIRIFGRSVHLPFHIFAERPSAIVMGFAKVGFIVGYMWARILRIPVGFHVEPIYESWGKIATFTQWIRRRIFHGIVAVETHGDDGIHYARTMGARKAKIFAVPHTVNPLIYQSDERAQKTRAQQLREELRLEGVTFVYVGRFWWGKSLDTLLKAFCKVQKSSSDPVSLLLIGDGPEEMKLRRLVSDLGLRNVVFVDFVQQIDLPPYYRASHVFVFPTLGDPYGIAPDEAMTCGLPIISTTEAGEIYARVEDWATGFLVPPKDVDAMAEKMRIFVDDQQLIQKMGRAAKERVKDHTPAKWAEGMIEMYKYMLAKNK